MLKCPLAASPAEPQEPQPAPMRASHCLGSWPGTSSCSPSNAMEMRTGLHSSFLFLQGKGMLWSGQLSASQSPGQLGGRLHAGGTGAPGQAVLRLSGCVSSSAGSRHARH